MNWFASSYCEATSIFEFVQTRHIARLFALLLLPPPLPLSSLLFITSTEFSIVITVVWNIEHGSTMAGRVVDIDKVSGILIRIFMLLDDFAEFCVCRIDKLVGGKTGLVLDSCAGAGLKHHLDEGVAEGSLRGRL